MGRTYRTARGRPVDMDQLRSKNEEVISVGNMNVNARGDQLGTGGKVVKSRNKVMKEFYKGASIQATPDHVPAPKKAEEPKKPVEEKTTDKPLRGELAKKLKAKKESE